jgi:hypothetical protein
MTLETSKQEVLNKNSSPDGFKNLRSLIEKSEKGRSETVVKT